MTLIRRETHELARVFMVLTASVFYQGTIAKREQKLVNVFHPKPIPRVRPGISRLILSTRTPPLFTVL